MRKTKAVDTILRVWGLRTPLDVKGTFISELETRRGARIRTKVFIVQGFRPEPLMGDRAEAELVFTTFNPKGREATEEKIRRERESGRQDKVNKIDIKPRIPDKI